MSDEIFEALKKGFDQAAKATTKKGDNPFGSLQLHKGGDINIDSHVPWGTPTGIPELDLRVRGGYPAGKVVELYGFQYCGKTTAALHAVREVQKKGGHAIWIDAERAWDDDRAKDLGINLDNMSLVTANTVEAIMSSIDIALDQIQSIEKPPRFLIVVDSITGVPTEKEMQTHLTNEARIGHEAKQIRRGIKGLMGKLAATKATIIFINQSIAKISSMPFAKQSQAAGGHAIKFFATVRIEFAPKKTVKDSEKDRLGQEIVLNCEKLRATLKQPRIESVRLLDDIGFDAETSLLNAALETGLVTKKNQRTFVLADSEFSASDWSEIVRHNGGYDNVYKAWRQDAQKKGILIPWGVSKYTVNVEEDSNDNA